MAVEFVSPNDPAVDVERKIHFYLDNGVQEVWVFYLETRHVQVWRPGSIRELTASDTLSTDLIPGFSLPLQSYFEEIFPKES